MARGARTVWAAAGVLLALATRPASGASLAEQLRTDTKTGNLANTLVTRLVRTAVRGADFPATSTTPSFTYEFDHEIGAFERSTQLGPEFAERAETIGQGRVEISLLYLHVDYQELDGDSLDGLRLGPETFQLSGSGAIITQDVVFSKFTLTSDVASFQTTYGLTDRWDVNLLVPLVWTSLDAAGRSSSQIAGNVGGVSTRFEVNDSKFGVGDILLRTKLSMVETQVAALAAGLTVRLPTGEAEDFQGLGDVVLTPLFVASRARGRFDVHVNLAFDVNADELDRSRFRYGVGATLQATDRIAVLVDFLGSSGVADDTFTDPSGREDTVARSDEVFAMPGLKLELFRSLVAFTGVIVPLTSDGLQATVIPAGSVKWTF